MKYNSKIEEVSKVMKQIYTNFALEYGEIQKLDLAETEKSIQEYKDRIVSIKSKLGQNS